MWHMGDGWGWWMLFGWLWMIGFWLLIIWAVLALVRGLSGRDRERSSQVSPTSLEILQQRYARGEITDEEYERMRQRLLGSSHG